MKSNNPRKIISMFAIISCFVIFVAGCSFDNNKSSTKTEQMYKNKRSDIKVSKKISKKRDTNLLWNLSKDQLLEKRINRLGDSNNVTYSKYDQIVKLNTENGQIFPDALKDAKVYGTDASIGWDKTGNGNYNYNVVAIYNSNDLNNNETDSSNDEEKGSTTYLFAFHEKVPVVLSSSNQDDEVDSPHWVKSSDNGLLNIFKETNNQKIYTNEEDKGITNTYRDPRYVGIMMYQYLPGGATLDSMMTDKYLECYLYNGKYIMGSGHSASNIFYKLNGNRVEYWRRDFSGGEASYEAPLIKYSINLDELISKYYSTNGQKQKTKEIADRMS